MTNPFILETENGRLLWEQTKDGMFWVHFQGETYTFRKESRRKKHKANLSESPEVIKAPMPGKITGLLKKEGDAIQAGDVVVVMEAMKMEYNLKSVENGEISKIICQVGDQVQLGQDLVRIKSE